MTQQGAQWIEAIKHKKQMYDSVETDKFAREGSLSHFEDEGNRIAERLMERDIPDGITSCVSRGSDRLAIPVPLWFFGTEGFQKLRRWAESEGLILNMGWARDRDFDSDEKFSVNVFPDRKSTIDEAAKLAKVS